MATKNKRARLLSCILLIVLLIVSAILYKFVLSDNGNEANNLAVSQNNNHKNSEAEPVQNKDISNEVEQSFDKSKYSTASPDSLWVVVNKKNPISPKDYVASDLVLPSVRQRLPNAAQMKMRKPASDQLEKMFKDASTEGYSLMISTAYRGYGLQSTLYSNYLKTDGRAKADTYSARPGYSEHQTGLAVDIQSLSGQCRLEQCFGNMAEAKWLASNAYKYGFILRYPKDKEATTGYIYEPWHFRYVGLELAEEMRVQGTVTLEDFFNLGPAPNY